MIKKILYGTLEQRRLLPLNEKCIVVSICDLMYLFLAEKP